MIYLTPSLLADTVILVLCMLLLSAAWSDIRSRRIPNKLVLLGLVAGVACNSLMPEGDGFISALPGALGFQNALAGIAVGFGLMLPLYLLRAMGAGDVKLMAMVGAFLGPEATANAVLATFIAGGMFGLAVVLCNGTLGRLLGNLRTMLLSSFFKLAMRDMPTLDAASVSAGKLPYAVAIGAGTAACIVTHSFNMYLTSPS